MQDELQSTPPKNVGRRTAIFVVVVGAVLGTFVFLGGQGRPPTMPRSPQHTLQFNLKGELIGISGEPGLDAASQPGVEVDKKATEARINASCLTCHGTPGVNPDEHPCKTTGRCLPPHHPPKSECIKCHRMTPAGEASSTATTTSAATPASSSAIPLPTPAAATTTATPPDAGAGTPADVTP